MKAIRKPQSTPGRTTYGGKPVFMLPQVTPAGAGLQFGGGELEQATNPRYRDAQSTQWNVTVERELTSNTSLRVSYVGMNSYRLTVTENLNQTKPSTTPYNFANAPFQNWGVIFSTNNLGGQNYQALELEGTHRMAKGLSYNANLYMGSQHQRRSGRCTYRIPG